MSFIFETEAYSSFYVNHCQNSVCNFFNKLNSQAATLRRKLDTLLTLQYKSVLISKLLPEIVLISNNFQTDNSL